MKKNRLIIGIVITLVTVGFIICCILIFGNSGNDTAIYSTNDYRYNNTVHILDNGKIEIEFEKGDLKDGKWSCKADDDTIVSFSVNKGKNTDVVTLTGKNTGSTQITATLNDGTNDIYKVIFNYTKFTEDAVIECIYECNIDDNLTFGDDKVCKVTCVMDKSTCLRASFTGDISSAEIDCDFDKLDAYFEYDSEGNEYLYIYAIDADFETSVKVRTDSFTATLNINIDENFNIKPVSGTVITNNNNSADVTQADNESKTDNSN